MTRFLSLMFALYFLITPVFAHPGRTDSAGGHYDRSTGEYHWHHGMSAHQHYDMDGDGILDCPYNFKDTTNHSSGSSSSYSYTTAPATFATVPTTSSPRATTAPQETTTEKKEGKNGMIGWIVSLALVIALYGCSKSHQQESDIDQDRMRKKDQEIQSLKKSLEAKDKALADLDEEMKHKLAAAITEANSYKEKYIVTQAKLDSIYSVSENESDKTDGERISSLSAQICDLKEELQDKENKITDLSSKLDKYIRLEQIPKDVYIRKDGLPVLLKSDTWKYGDYTAYLSKRSMVYHMDYLCAPAGAPAVHLFKVPNSYRACMKCALGTSRIPPDWYVQLQNE